MNCLLHEIYIYSAVVRLMGAAGTASQQLLLHLRDHLAVTGKDAP
jgi:hypothetical protein